MHRFWIAVLWAAFCGVASADDGIEHVVYPETTTYGPTVATALDKHLEDSAREYRLKYPGGAARFVYSDLALPKDIEEYRAFGKYGVILVSAISQDNAELPLSRVYLQNGARRIDLKRVASGLRETAAGSAAREMFGPFREDSFYLVPIEELGRGTWLVCDFAVNRLGFVVTKDLDDDQPEFIVADTEKKPGPEPATALLNSFIEREYPGIRIAP